MDQLAGFSITQRHVHPTAGEVTSAVAAMKSNGLFVVAPA
jgi:hypothetical protein